MAKHPKENPELLGFEAVEAQLMQRFQQQKMPHAILLSGQRGIGKATLAYRLARYVLSGGEGGGGLFGPENLSLPADHPIFGRVVAGSHSDFHALTQDDEDGEKAEIKVDEARKVAEFLSLTPGESDWRVVVIDSADALNTNAANSLLKIIEEPPEQALLILVSHNLGRVLPTIRSRCHTVKLQPHSQSNFERIMALAGCAAEGAELAELYDMSGGSPGLALSFHEYKLTELYQLMLEAFGTSGEARSKKIQAIAARVGGKDPQLWQLWQHAWMMLMRRVLASAIGQDDREWVSGEKALLKQLHTSKPVESWMAISQRSKTLLDDTERLYLDKKQTIHSLLGMATGAIAL